MPSIITVITIWCTLLTVSVVGQWERRGEQLLKSTMYSFKMAPNNVLLWIVALGLRYRDQPGYVTEWTNYKSQDESIDTIEAIFLQVSRKEPCEKVVKIKVYITTLTVTLQGKNIKSWVDTEFEILKDFVYANQNTESSIQSHDITHYDTTETVEGKDDDSIFSPLNSDDEQDDISEIIEQDSTNHRKYESDPQQTKVDPQQTDTEKKQYRILCLLILNMIMSKPNLKLSTQKQVRCIC